MFSSDGSERAKVELRDAMAPGARIGCAFVVSTVSRVRSFTLTEIAHNGLANRGSVRGVPLSFGAAIGGLCASMEFAHNGLAKRGSVRGVPLSFGATIGVLCAFAFSGIWSTGVPPAGSAVCTRVVSVTCRVRSFAFTEIAHNGLANRGSVRGIPLSFGATIGGLCAFMEFAHNGLAKRGSVRGVPLSFGAAIGGLCAFSFLRRKTRCSVRDL
jgi:hypothetical protein